MVERDRLIAVNTIVTVIAIVPRAAFAENIAPAAGIDMAAKTVCVSKGEAVDAREIIAITTINQIAGIH